MGKLSSPHGRCPENITSTLRHLGSKALLDAGLQELQKGLLSPQN